MATTRHRTTKPTMVRVSEQAKRKLAELASAEDKSQVAIVDEALEAYEEQRFYESVRAGYQALRSDPAAWAEYKRESAVFEGTIADGLPVEG